MHPADGGGLSLAVLSMVAEDDDGRMGGLGQRQAPTRRPRKPPVMGISKPPTAIVISSEPATAEPVERTVPLPLIGPAGVSQRIFQRADGPVKTAFEIRHSFLSAMTRSGVTLRSRTQVR